ncbi:3'-5' exonuclease [Deinococcus cavernae]|nr:3'-5' exonuclease [Deinococcus cavernae]
MTLLNVVYVEATCWEGEPPSGQRNEIIEIGIVVLNLKTLERTDKRSIMVHPEHSEISEFCTRLTGITAEEVASGITFQEACDLLRQEYHTDSRPWASWGDYDRKQFQSQSVGDIRYPFSSRHTNAKQVYADAYNLKRAGMVRALRNAGLPLEGSHHRGADDAWNIAALISKMVSEGHWPTDPLQALADDLQEMGLQ